MAFEEKNNKLRYCFSSFRVQIGVSRTIINCDCGFPSSSTRESDLYSKHYNSQTFSCLTTCVAPFRLSNVSITSFKIINSTSVRTIFLYIIRKCSRKKLVYFKLTLFSNSLYEFNSTSDSGYVFHCPHLLLLHAFNGRNTRFYLTAQKRSGSYLIFVACSIRTDLIKM